MNTFDFYRDLSVLLEKHGLVSTTFSVKRVPGNRILNKPARTEILLEVPE